MKKYRIEINGKDKKGKDAGITCEKVMIEDEINEIMIETIAAIKLAEREVGLKEIDEIKIEKYN